MPTTATWLLPYPLETAPADVPVDIQALANRLETVLSQVRQGAAIPGEIKMWSGAAVPDPALYGHWVWADGAAYASATYPLASANIASAWKTHGGKADPGAGQFRVPDLRGQTPIGLDQMPGGSQGRAFRLTRAAAATLAAVTGEEYHTLLLAELAAHGHGVADLGHYHNVNTHVGGAGSGSSDTLVEAGTGVTTDTKTTGITINTTGGGGAHENLPTTTFVPYIVKLDN